MAHKRIDSASNPTVKELASLRERRAREASGTFLVEGAREAARALAADVTPLRLVFTAEAVAGRPDVAELVAAAERRGVPLLELSTAAFARLSLRQNQDGVALQAATPPQGDAVLAITRLEHDPLVLVLDGIEKPGNLGALLRTADAAGVDLVIVTGAGTDLTNPNVIRASQGSVFAVRPVVASDAEALGYLRAAGVRLVATTPAASTPHYAADLRGAVALLVGAEATGLRPAWLEVADVCVTIPMRSQAADSLNASVAGAVVLYEALRQRSTAVAGQRAR